MGFKTEPILRAMPEAGLWKLEAPLVYASNAGELLVVPPGFLTDLASIPRVFHSLFPVNGRHRAPAILHDFLYITQSMDRAAADAMFLEAMEAAGVGWFQRKVMYLAVRAGGWSPWNGYAKALEEAPDAHLADSGL